MRHEHKPQEPPSTTVLLTRLTRTKCAGGVHKVASVLTEQDVLLQRVLGGHPPLESLVAVAAVQQSCTGTGAGAGLLSPVVVVVLLPIRRELVDSVSFVFGWFAPRNSLDGVGQAARLVAVVVVVVLPTVGSSAPSTSS